MSGLLCKLATNRCNTYNIQQVAGWAYGAANGWSSAKSSSGGIFSSGLLPLGVLRRKRYSYVPVPKKIPRNSCERERPPPTAQCPTRVLRLLERRLHRLNNNGGVGSINSGNLRRGALSTRRKDAQVVSAAYEKCGRADHLGNPPRMSDPLLSAGHHPPTHVIKQKRPHLNSCIDRCISGEWTHQGVRLICTVRNRLPRRPGIKSCGTMLCDGEREPVTAPKLLKTLSRRRQFGIANRI